jgi:hypothetical protein
MGGVCSRQQQRRLSTEQLRDISLSPCMSAHTLETAVHTTQQQASDGNEKLVVAHLITNWFLLWRPNVRWRGHKTSPPIGSELSGIKKQVPYV